MGSEGSVPRLLPLLVLSFLLSACGSGVTRTLVPAGESAGGGSAGGTAGMGGHGGVMFAAGGLGPTGGSGEAGSTAKVLGPQANGGGHGGQGSSSDGERAGNDGSIGGGAGRTNEGGDGGMSGAGGAGGGGGIAGVGGMAAPGGASATGGSGIGGIPVGGGASGQVGTGGQGDAAGTGGAASSGNGGASEGNPGGRNGATQCPVSQSFGALTAVAGLTGQEGVSFTRFTPDERVAFLTSMSGGYGDIATSFRASLSEPFGSAGLLASLNGPGDDGAPTVTDDGLTLYFHSTRSGGYRLYSATRPRVDVEFSPPAELTALNVYGEGNPYVTRDGSALYFHSWRDGSNDLFRAARTTAGFEVPEKLAVSTSTFDEYDPVVSPDELTVYYAVIGSADGKHDGIWMATRSSKLEPFGNATALSEIHSDYVGVPVPSWISPDGCRLYVVIYTGQIYGVRVTARAP